MPPRLARFSANVTCRCAHKRIRALLLPDRCRWAVAGQHDRLVRQREEFVVDRRPQCVEVAVGKVVAAVDLTTVGAPQTISDGMPGPGIANDGALVVKTPFTTERFYGGSVRVTL